MKTATTKEKIIAVLRSAAAELAAIAPKGADESMALMDEIGYDYRSVLDDDKDYQDSQLQRLGRNRFNWLVNEAMSEFDDFRP